MIVSAQPGQTDSTGEEPRIQFLDLTDIEIAEILRMISDSAEWNIIPSQGVRGKVNVFLKDISPEEALDKLVNVNGYRLVRDGRTITIMTEAEYEVQIGAETKQMIFPLQYAHAATAVGLIQGALSTRGKVIPDSLNNQLIVYDMEHRSAGIAALVEEIDQPRETRVFKLDHAQAVNVYQSILPFVGDPSLVSLDERSNQLIVTETAYHLDRLTDIIKSLDLEDLTETRAFRLKYANAQDVADLLIEMITGESSDSGRQRNTRSDSSSDRPVPVAGGVNAQSARSARNESRSYLSSSAERGAAEPLASGRSGLSATAAGSGDVSTAPSQGLQASMADTAEFGGGEARALGVLGTIVADPRTNTVIVTHSPTILKRVESVIGELDIHMDLHVYQLEHANLEELGLDEKLATLLSGPNEDYQIDVSTRKLTFRAPEERAMHILALLKEWDASPPQVYIEARLIRVSLDFAKDLGVTIRALDVGSDDALNAAVDVLFPPSIPASPQGLVQFGDLSADDYTIILQALENDSRSKLLSNPKVTVQDRRQANFQVVTDQPFVEVVTDANSDITRESTRFIPVGVTLQVVPSIDKAGFIQMDTRFEVSSLLGTTSSGTPIVDRSEAQTSVIVKDGHTLGIGGLILDEKIETINRVPILGHIPLLKYLFSNKSIDNQQSELLLFITPRIISYGDAELPPDELEFRESRVRLN